MTIRLFTRREALRSFGVALAAPMSGMFAPNAFANPGGALNFLAVGDWGREGAFHQADVAARMGESAGAIDARFIISVGDNFYEDGVAGVDDPQWKTSFEDVYTAPSLQVPWHAILGNHDYHGNSQAQIDYSASSHRWRMPARWFSRSETAPDGATVDLFFIDTSPFISAYHENGAEKVKVAGQDPAAQLAWLDRSLEDSGANWKIVVGHHPVWPLRPEPSGQGIAQDMQAELNPILVRHQVPLYLNGHDHDLQHTAVGGTNYICTGAGSKLLPSCDMGRSDFCALDSGFVTCQVDRAAIRVVYVDYKGVRLHVVDIPRFA